MPKPPSTIDRAFEAMQAADSPMTLRELLAAIEAQEPIHTKNPLNTLRSAVGNTGLIVSTGDGRYDYVPRAATGCVLRQPLDPGQAESDLIVWEEEIVAAVWPAFREMTAQRRDSSARTFRCGEDVELALRLERTMPYHLASPGARPLWQWLADQGVRPGDSLLVRLVDGPAGLVQLSLARSADRDETTLRERNEVVADALEEVLGKRQEKRAFTSNAAAELIARGVYRHACPPDSLRAVVAADDRFEMDGLSVYMPHQAPPWARSPGRAEELFQEPPAELLAVLSRELESLTGVKWQWEAPGVETGAAAPVKRRTGPKRSTGPARVFQLKVTLRGVRPPVWRRIQVLSDIVLADLHEVIQAVMGWYNCHLYEFWAGSRRLGLTAPEFDPWDDDLEDARDGTLSELVAKEKSKLLYTYDFGDGWEHEILLEKILEPEPGAQYPVCLKGKRACPPEDCGGVWGYADFLEAIADPQHEEHEELLEWIGGEFDPEAFDLDEVNRRLRSVG